MTPMSEIIVNNGKVIIDDARLTDLLASNPALFFRRMWLYLHNAIPLFNRPPEMRSYLTTGMVEPSFAEYYWTSTEQSKTGVTTVATGKTGYELFSCYAIEQDGAGNVIHIPYAHATYDSVTGNVTFPIQNAAGIEYGMDFYKDGYFAPDLTIAQRRILGLCINAVWYEPVTNNWLNMQPKISDRDFEIRSESAHTNAMTNRLNSVRAHLNAELKKYEQDCAYEAIVQSKLTKFI